MRARAAREAIEGAGPRPAATGENWKDPAAEDRDMDEGLSEYELDNRDWIAIWGMAGARLAHLEHPEPDKVAEAVLISFGALMNLKAYLLDTGGVPLVAKGDGDFLGKLAAREREDMAGDDLVILGRPRGSLALVHSAEGSEE